MKLIVKTLSLLITILPVFSLSRIIISENHKGNIARAGGGSSFGMLMLDTDELNDIITEEEFGELDNTMLLYGGGGFGGEKLGPRLGGFGAGGSIQSTNNDKTAILDIGYGGFVYERGLYALGNLDIDVGALIGGGGMDLTLIHNEPGSFSDIVDGINEEEDPIAITASKGFLTLNPKASLNYKATDFLILTLNAGYLFTYSFDDNWKISDETVEDGPLSNFHAPHLSLQVSFGF